MKRRWIMRIGMLIVAIHMGAVATQADETVPSKEPPNLVTNVVERVNLLKANLPSVFEMHLWPDLCPVTTAQIPSCAGSRLRGNRPARSLTIWRSRVFWHGRLIGRIHRENTTNGRTDMSWKSQPVRVV